MLLREFNLIGPLALSRLLGISRNMVYRMVRHRKIPFNRVGSLIKFEVRDIVTWWEANKVTAVGA